MSGTFADPRSPLEQRLAGLGEALAGGPFAAFVVALLVLFSAGMGLLLVVPTAAPGLGSFAADFRTWCFGLDQDDPMGRWAWVLAMLTSPLLLAALVALAWSSPLREAWASTRPAVVRSAAGGAVALLVLAAAAYASFAGPTAPVRLAFPAADLRTSLPVPKFALTDQAGRPVDSADWAGRVVVLTSIFSRCGTACPLILGQAQRAVAALPEGATDDLQVVGISMDAAYDRPEVLARLLERHGLDPAIFRLATGDAAAVDPLLDRLGFERSRDPATGLLSHGNLFIVIDRQGRIAYRFSLGELQEAWLTEALRVLLAEGRPTPGA